MCAMSHTWQLLLGGLLDPGNVQMSQNYYQGSKTFPPSLYRHRVFEAHPGVTQNYLFELSSQFESQYPGVFPRTKVRSVFNNAMKEDAWMDDVKVFGYRQRSKAGEVFNNSMTHYTEKWNNSPGVLSQRPSQPLHWKDSSGKITTTSAHDNGFGLWSGFDFLPAGRQVRTLANECSDMLDRSRILAITDAAADIESTDLSSLVSLKELPETVEWFISIFTRAIGIKRTFLKKFKNLERELRANGGFPSKDRVKSILLAMENLRMEYRYAVRPLLGEMENIAKFFHNPKISSPRMTARGYRKIAESKITEVPFKVPGTFPMFPTSCTATVHETYDVNVRAGFLLECNLDELSSLYHRLGFNQSLSAAWESLPLSFVLDWLMNLGSLLAALEPKAGSNILAGWVSIDEDYKYRLDGSGSSIHTVDETHNGETQTHRTVTQLSGLSLDMGFTRKTRVPTTLRDVGLRLDINLDFHKILDLITIARNLR